MKYKKFTVSQYKALSKVELSLRNSLIPIIGINESGKSSFLHAILAFDKYNDDLLSGYHLNAKNRYDYDSTNHIVKAHLEFDEADELISLKKKLKVSKTNKTFSNIEDYYKKNKELVISRNLDNKKYDLEGIECEQSIKDKILEEIISNLPYILFFDDFNDRVPDKISFPADYIVDKDDEEDEGSKNEWNSYVEEIFTRATQDSLKSFITNKSKNDRDGILSDVNDILNEDIIKNWKKLKVLDKELTSEKITDLVLSLDYEIDNDSNHVFSFKVIDKNFQGKGRYFSITERSKGFQWFFNFAIKLKFNPKYIEDYDGAIYLLDEPGSYLHSSAQEELLKSLKKISETNKVIYCTHSQYLLNPDVINLSSIKIATRSQGKISFQNFGEYEESSKSQGSLSPLYDALHLNIAKHSFPRNEKVLITEGIIDYYFLKMIKEFLPMSKNLNFHILPGAGATNLKDLISLSIAWTDKYSLLLDSDTKGIEAFEKYKTFFGESEAEKWILLGLPNKGQNVRIESLLSKSDQQRLFVVTSTKQIKKAIPLLFYMTTNEKKLFFKALTEESLKNIHNLMNQIFIKLDKPR